MSTFWGACQWWWWWTRQSRTVIDKVVLITLTLD